MKTTRTAEELNGFGRGHLPALIGLEIVAVRPEEAHSRLARRVRLSALRMICQALRPCD